MSKFVSDKLKKIDLGDKEWVKIPVGLSFQDSLKMTGEGQSTEELAVSMLFLCIKEWNIKDDEGKIPKINKENILRLDSITVTTISNEITNLMSNQNKKK